MIFGQVVIRDPGGSAWTGLERAARGSWRQTAAGLSGAQLGGFTAPLAGRNLGPS